MHLFTVLYLGVPGLDTNWRGDSLALPIISYVCVGEGGGEGGSQDTQRRKDIGWVGSRPRYSRLQGGVRNYYVEFKRNRGVV